MQESTPQSQKPLPEIKLEHLPYLPDSNLDKLAEELDILETDGKISTEDRLALRSAIATARKGDWKELQAQYKNMPRNVKDAIETSISKYAAWNEERRKYPPVEVGPDETFDFASNEFYALFGDRPESGFDVSGTFWDEYGPSPFDEFFKSKFYSKEGLLALLEHIGRIEKENESEELGSMTIGEYFEEVDPENLTQDQYGHGDWEMRSLFDDNYNQRRFVIEMLGDVGAGDSEVADKILAFMKNSVWSHIYTAESADALNRIDALYAAGALLNELREMEAGKKKPPHDLYKKDIGKMLYRLELGRIGISEEGVNYLGRLYDLGDYNNSDFFVNRITPSGDIGVFNEEKKLKGLFNLGDPTPSDEKVTAHILDLSYDMLFTRKVGESLEEHAEKERILAEFKEKYFEFYDEKFFRETGVHFNNFSLKEQGWFLEFARNAPAEKRERAFEFVKEYGENGLRTFLSIDHDRGMGEKILNIGENLRGHGARNIFAKYSELVDASQTAEEFLCKEFGCSNEENAELSRRIRDNLLQKGKNLLAEFANEIGKSESSGEQLPDEGEIIEKLRGTKTDILLFGEGMRAMRREHPEMDIAELANIEIEGVHPRAFAESREDVENMRGIYQANYANKPEEFREYLLHSFNDKLSAESGRFYTVRYGGKIIAFASFTDLPNGDTYFGAFNTDPNARGATIGGYMLDGALKQEVALAGERGGKITAHAIPGTDILKHYIEKDGFKIDPSSKEELVHGVPLVKIVLDRSREPFKKAA